MSDKMNAFLEAASRDRDLMEKLRKAETPQAVIALAEEKGFPLTEEDLKPAKAETVSDEELDAVAGGTVCFCVPCGGGEAGVIDRLCACVMFGIGDYVVSRGSDGKITMVEGRCYCLSGGGGKSME